MSFFVTGEVRGWASPSVPSLQGHDGLNNSLSYAPLTKEAASWISITELSECRDTKNIETFFLKTASSPPIGAIPAALIASVLLQLIGRRKTLILAFFMFLVTFVVLGTARLHESYLAIVASRSLTGVAVGFCMPAAQIYVCKSF